MKGSNSKNNLNIVAQLARVERGLQQVCHAVGIVLEDSDDHSSSMEPGERRETKKRSRSRSRSRTPSRSLPRRSPPRRARTPPRRRQSEAQIWNAEGGSNHKDSFKIHFKKAPGVMLANTGVIREIFNAYGRVTHIYFLGNHGSVGFASRDDCNNCLDNAQEIERNNGISVVPYKH